MVRGFLRGGAVLLMCVPIGAERFGGIAGALRLCIVDVVFVLVA